MKSDKTNQTKIWIYIERMSGWGTKEQVMEQINKLIAPSRYMGLWHSKLNHAINRQISKHFSIYHRYEIIALPPWAHSIDSAFFLLQRIRKKNISNFLKWTNSFLIESTKKNSQQIWTKYRRWPGSANTNVVQRFMCV